MNKSEIKQILEDIDQIKKFRKTLKRWTEIAYEKDERGYLGVFQGSCRLSC